MPTLFLGNGSQIHSHQYARLRKFIYTYHRPGRAVVTHLLNVGTIQLIEILHALEEDVYMHNMAKVRSDGLQHDPEGIEYLPGRGIYVWPCQLARCRIYSCSSSDTHKGPNSGNVIVRPDWR